MTTKRRSLKAWALLTSAAVVGLILTGGGVACACFTASSSIPGNSANTATLGAPTGFAASWDSDGSSALSWNVPPIGPGEWRHVGHRFHRAADLPGAIVEDEAVPQAESPTPI